MHAYKRPSCQFLKRNRSEQFIEEAIDSHYRNQLRAAAAAAAVRTPVLERRHQWGSGSIEAGPDVLPEYVPDDRPQSVINRCGKGREAFLWNFTFVASVFFCRRCKSI